MCIRDRLDSAEEADDDLLQEASVSIDDKSIEEEIELSGAYKDIVEEKTKISYTIFTTQYDETIEAKELTLDDLTDADRQVIIDIMRQNG